MANNVMFNVNPTFDMEVFAAKLADTYRVKGYDVNVANMNGMCTIAFDKGTGGINMLLGLGEGIKATITKMNDTLMINYSDAEWTGKIIGCVVGWFLCMIPMITAIIGIVKQTSLPKKISNDATMIASTL
ncbi:MAG: hypothetical protein IJW04_02675 [Ruminococcus sp.]|nr:hypothetical protein [Ruminococcus sp.]